MPRSPPPSAAPSPTATSSRRRRRTPMASDRSLANRHREPEEMDDPAIATERLRGALTGLRRLNFVSNSARIVWRPIRQLAHDLKTDRLRVLDIATGAGDVPIVLRRRATRGGLKLDICGIDFSPPSIDFA